MNIPLPKPVLAKPAWAFICQTGIHGAMTMRNRDNGAVLTIRLPLE